MFLRGNHLAMRISWLFVRRRIHQPVDTRFHRCWPSLAQMFNSRLTAIVIFMSVWRKIPPVKKIVTPAAAAGRGSTQNGGSSDDSAAVNKGKCYFAA
jgi:hypothetical protein